MIEKPGCIHVEPSNPEMASKKLSSLFENKKQEEPSTKKVYLQIVETRRCDDETRGRFDQSHMETESDEKLIGSQLLVVHNAATIDQTLRQLYETYKASVEPGHFYYRLVVI